ncbi:type II toxin-antitoxin system RelE/ParE family toxin [Granulosicoccus sp. 3-233]|uniref:type II toxin-antitoxin system RelE/ParE family toxin n=1 Tax=Granulosicoccus sp. 3-233 TaxID=3417969 RepID=UPI003D33B925
MTYLNEVDELQDLRELRSNRFEALIGKRKGQYSIRINKQWRLCFRWGPDGPEDVEVVDYH